MKKVISFSAQTGPNTRNLMEQQVYAASRLHPGWICRFYASDPEVLEAPLSNGGELVRCDDDLQGEHQTVRKHRALDDPSTLSVMVRDLKVRPTLKEAVAVNKWVLSDFPLVVLPGKRFSHGYGLQNVGLGLYKLILNGMDKEQWGQDDYEDTLVETVLTELLGPPKKLSLLGKGPEMFFYSNQCLSGLSCVDCRKEDPHWRKKVAREFRIKKVDFECPHGKRWGLVDKPLFETSDRCVSRQWCELCRNKKEGALWRAAQELRFKLPEGGIDFECPFGVEWVNPMSVTTAVKNVVHAGKQVIKKVFAKKYRAPRAVRDMRHEICTHCPHSRPCRKGSDSLCCGTLLDARGGKSTCGCVLKQKQSVRNEKCPQGLWGPYVPDSQEGKR